MLLLLEPTPLTPTNVAPGLIASETLTVYWHCHAFKQLKPTDAENIKAIKGEDRY